MSNEKTFGDRPMLIGGEMVPSESGEWLESLDPSSEQVHGRVPAGTAKDVALAVDAAAVIEVEAEEAA